VYTEIVGDIKKGEQVVTGLNKSKASLTDQKPTGTQNPFMPKFPSQKKNK
jgi:hypothetical protein